MTVGTTSSDYGTAISGVVTMSKGQSIHYAFTQTTAGTAFFHGFAVRVQTTASADLAAIRCDNWENIENTNSRFTNTFPNGWGADAATFQSTYMNGASVDMTITYSAEGAFTMASTITKDENDYTYNWTKTFDGTPDQVNVTLVADHAQLVITDYPVPTMSVPSTFDFSAAGTHAASPFDNSTWAEGTNVKAIRIANGSATTATAYFDSNLTTDGNQAYTLASNEKVTFTLNPYMGYVSNLNAKFSIVNSADVELVSYTYNYSSCTVTDVKIGGVTADGFAAFSGQSRYNSTQGANGLVGNGKPYQTTSGYNPVVTITISGSGAVTFSYVVTQTSVNASYTGTLGGSVVKNLAKIVINDNTTNADRSYCLGQFSISTETVSEANVTYKFVDTSDNDLSSIVADKVAAATIGANIEDVIPASYKSDFYNGDASIKYVYSTYTCSDATVQAGGSTVTLKFAPKEKFTYTKRAVKGSDVLNATLATGYAYEDETVTLSWSRYIKVGEQWYVATTGTYQSSSTTDATEDVEYITSDIAYFYEMESGLTRSGGSSLTDNMSIASSLSGANAVRLSRGSLYYTPALAAGVYTLSIPWRNTNGSASEVYVYTRTAGGVLSDALTTFTASASNNGTFTYVITVPDGYSIAFNGNEGGSANNNARMDYMTLTPITSVSKSISSAGWATYCSPYALDFSSAIANLDAAYIVTGGADGVLTTEAVTTTVAANTGLLLKGSAGTVTIPVVASGTDYSTTNKLVGVTANTEIAAESGYVLMNDATNGLGFYKNAAAFTVGANTSYIPLANLPEPSTARGFFLLDGETTGVGAALMNKAAMNNEVYNLQGQRVAQPAKGLYIVNGKKVIIK